MTDESRIAILATFPKGTSYLIIIHHFTNLQIAMIQPVAVTLLLIFYSV